jgi:hypothetical protein
VRKTHLHPGNMRGRFVAVVTKTRSWHGFAFEQRSVNLFLRL